MSPSIEFILETAQTYLPTLNTDRLKEAYRYARKAHEGQKRFSGDPYITHSLETAAILLPLKPDEDTLIAALLHDVPSDTSITLKEIDRKFGGDVAKLIELTEKLSLIKLQSGQPQVEVWRKMFMAMAKDLRVIFLRLAERLHNMRTLEYVPVHKQERLAEETLRIYAPIASRLGIYSMKSELEDLCFRFLHPEEFRTLQSAIEEHGNVHQRYIEEARQSLATMLEQEGIRGEVFGRVKHLYSLYRKLHRKGTRDLNSIYDLFAMRIILEDQNQEDLERVGHCYTTLGALHNRWTPMPGRFKDYIAVPKLNGYRSLHTTLLGLLSSLKRQPIEVQVRTAAMHHEAEYGIASHWWYDDPRHAAHQISKYDVESFLGQRRLVNQFHDLLSRFPAQRGQFERFLSPQPVQDATLRYELKRFLEKHGFSSQEVEELIQALQDAHHMEGRLKALRHQIDWLYGLQNIQEDDSSEDSNLKMFRDRIFVLTPAGDVKDLPSGSTPVDFAYAVHTDVGHRCGQAKVNGNIVRLDHELKSGDVVEILTRKLPEPNRYWLSFLKSSGAKNKVKSWFRSVDREKNIRAGRDFLNKELKRFNKPLLDPNLKLLRDYGGKRLPFADREHIVELVGNGTMSAHSVLRNLFSEQELLGERVPRSLRRPSSLEKAKPISTKSIPQDEVLITGQADLPIQLSACCKPRAPHKILGYVTRGRAVRVHREGCRYLKDAPKERLLQASWASDTSYQVKLRVHGSDRVGMLRDLLVVVAHFEMNIIDVDLLFKDSGQFVRDLILEIPGYDRLTQLLNKLENVDGVNRIEKI